MTMPRDAQIFAYQPDPGDALSYAARFAALVDDGAAINPATLTVTTDAEDLGVRVLADGEQAPVPYDDGTTVIFWLDVEPGSRAAAAFDGMGTEVGITIAFETNHTPALKFERTGVLIVRQR